MKTGLLHPYPGSKKDWHKYPIWDERNYDSVIEPFVGAGHFTHRMLANGRVKNAFVSDIDPAVSVVWRAWSDTEPDDLGYWDGECGRDYIEDFVRKWSTGIRTAVIYNNPVNDYFDRLKDWLENGIETEPHHLAAASIILRKLVFGGVLRCNAQGKLNVALSQDKLNQFPSWHFEWPYFDKSWDLRVADSWQGCLRDFDKSECQAAIAFVDPPYWVPAGSRPGRRGNGALTQAYIHHGDPQGDATKALFLDCLKQLFDNPRVKRVVATNYMSPELVESVSQLGKKGVFSCRLTNLGTLQTMNNDANGSARSDAPSEGFWEFGGQMMAGRYEQKSLLELVA
ncbi:MAG: hypothetical protein F6K11_14220 [Leptolyngbya sp. SIO3F4]|nr:hypothetical protein [Leptolyngbya sp. SIO3F4]